MAEAVGVVLGVVGVIGTFKNCIDLFDYFSTHRSFGRDHQILGIKFQVQKALLLQWAARVRLVHPDCDRRLRDPAVQPTISRVLAGIQQLLSEVPILEQRYGLRATEPSNTTHISQNLDSRIGRMTSFRLRRFNDDFAKLKIDIKENPKTTSPLDKLRWVISDKEKFEMLVQELSSFVLGLNQLIPETKGYGSGETSSEAMAREDLSHLHDVRSLGLIYDATNGEQDLIAEAATEKLQDLYAERVLKNLWFQSLGDRKDAVTSPYPSTFHWALEYPDKLNLQDGKTQWDSLRTWLASKNRFYWISGKAGSGKSTLMKYLYHHRTAERLLTQWASPAPLSLGSYFFWNLGTLEQKSLNGLLRAILHQLVDVQRHLIPELLPKMWQEVQRKDQPGLSIPTDVELSSAIDKLSSHDGLDRSFCFFIDGLDEFDGNHYEAAKLVQKLAQNPRIKILTSSRPIPQCVLAFSECPSLRLQDLTRGDINKYIMSTVGSHVYMKTLQVSDPASVTSILEELMTKASGVFLWVVLACRSIIDGFAAYDNVQELKQRVDELPPELEDLFKHMLKRIEPRYHTQMARMLRVCHQRQKINADGEVNLVYTLAWAMMGNFDQKSDLVTPLRALSPEERSSICTPIEGRLRSRCGGLLELKPRAHNCQCGKDQMHDVVVDSSVEFLHRTMFEFLDNPETWKFDCLQIKDATFDANLALCVMSLHMARAHFGQLQNSLYDSFILDAIVCARALDVTMGNGAFIVLERLEEIVNIFPPTASSDPYVQVSPLRLAVESGISTCVKYLLEDTRGSTDGAHDQLGFPLLYHAIRQPHFRHVFSLRWNEDVVRLLLLSKCDPNEQFKNVEGLSTTPWRDWLCEVGRMGLSEFFLSLDLTGEFMKNGADMEVDGFVYVDHIVREWLAKVKWYTNEDLERRAAANRFVAICQALKERVAKDETQASNTNTSSKTRAESKKRLRPEEDDIPFSSSKSRKLR